MHTLHYIAVEADSIQHAFEEVYSAFEEDSPEWSDWHVIGGGRWNSIPSNQYQDSSNDVISYAENKELFDQALESVQKYRLDLVHENVFKSDLESINSLAVEYIQNGAADSVWNAKDGMTLWRIARGMDMLQGRYTSDSMFYDLSAHCTDFKYLVERLDKNPEKQYLVPVDFHF